MRKSKAKVFRAGLHKEDTLQEPISLYFSSMVAVGKSKTTLEQASVKNATRQEQIQSQANVLQNLMMLNFKINGADKDAQIGQIKNLSEVK